MPKRAPLRVVELLVALAVALAAVSCGSAYSYLRLSPEERRLFEIYSVSMTTSQQTEYLGRPTPAGRTAYARALGVQQRFLALPEGERKAVLGQLLVAGMSADALLMSWGYPWYRSRLGEDAEEWVYYPYLSRHLPPSVGYRIYLKGVQVSEWEQFVLPAAERGG